MRSLLCFVFLLFFLFFCFFISAEVLPRPSQARHKVVEINVIQKVTFPPLLTCANCKTTGKMLRCGKCKVVGYCTR